VNITLTHHTSPKPITVFNISGRIHLGNAQELRDQAKQEYERGMNHLLLDLSGVQSLTSEGLRCIHYIYNLLMPDNAPEGAEKKSPYVKILNPPAGIRKILNVSGFDLFLDIYDNLPEALASF